MSDSARPDRIEVGKREDFNRGLAQLRSTGATALITGSADPVAFHRISGHLLGDIEASRVPLFVLVAREQDLIQKRTRHPAAVNEFQIVEFMSDLADGYKTRQPKLQVPDEEDENGSEERESAAEQPKNDMASDEAPETTDLQILYDEIADGVESIARRYQLDDWDLRPAIDSCIPLLEYNELDKAIEFFDKIRTLTLEYTGLTHAVYPITLSSQKPPAADDSIDDLVDAFDLHIRVRSQQGQHETQWELPDFNCRTAWLELPPAHQTLP